MSEELAGVQVTQVWLPGGIEVIAQNPAGRLSIWFPFGKVGYETVTLDVEWSDCHYAPQQLLKLGAHVGWAEFFLSGGTLISE